MGSALLYLGRQFIFRIAEFFRHWYVDGLRFIAREATNLLESLDRFFAWKVTAKNLFQPLYQDHTVIGHTVGFLFRAARLTAGSALYACVISVALFSGIFWALIPIFIIWYGIQS